MNKKADNFLMENIIFFIIIAVFFATMFIFVARAGSQVTIVEQIYSKQIALAIDKAKPGTEVNLDVSKLYEIAEKNSFIGNVVKIDNENNIVEVRLVEGKGYGFEFFNNAEILQRLDNNEKKLILEVKK